MMNPIVLPVNPLRVPGQKHSVFLRQFLVGGPDVFRFKDVVVMKNERQILVKRLLAEPRLQTQSAQGALPARQGLLPWQPRPVYGAVHAVEYSLRPLDALLGS